MIIQMIGYMDPATEGTTLTFDCPPEYVLVGPNTTTCIGNGEWEPDPKVVECKGKGFRDVHYNDELKVHTFSYQPPTLNFGCSICKFHTMHSMHE